MRTDSRYFQQVRLLVEVLPAVAAEDCFALKGGTAINLFLHVLLRLSVDIDLTYLPITGYEAARVEIDRALRRIRDRLLGGSPPFEVAAGRGGAAAAHIDTLGVSRGGLDVKIEVNPVLRGALYPAIPQPIRPAAEAHFGFARMPVLAHDDLYAGKLMAALDRQHPRDLFDVMVLLEGAGITDALFRAWLVYLIGHKGNMADTLEPRRKELRMLYEGQFLQMANREVSLEQLEDARERMIRELHRHLGDREKRFLLSVKRGKPDWDLLGMPGVDQLPAVKWKLHNIGLMPAARHAHAVANLEKVLSEIGS
jgi:predicted nucleotidyltransferase component of viral defense system